MEGEHHEHNPEHHSHSESKNFTTKLRENPWMVATFVLGIAVLVLLVPLLGVSGGASSSKAADNLVNYLNGIADSPVTLKDVKSENGLYLVTVNYKSQDVALYVTKDGKSYTSSLISMTENAGVNTGGATATEVPKSDKPKVELFVMSYCPFGTQMEKGILPVVSALGDKIDFTLRYTHFTLHGEKEDTENFRQICIREEQSDKFLKYIQCTLNSTDPYTPADVNVCMTQGGIDKSKVDSCISNKAKDYYKVDSGLSQGYGVQGSPTLVINGVQADSARSPSAVLATICSSFNDAPAECSTQLATASPSAGFGYTAGNSGDSAALNCGV